MLICMIYIPVYIICVYVCVIQNITPHTKYFEIYIYNLCRTRYVRFFLWYEYSVFAYLFTYASKYTRMYDVLYVYVCVIQNITLRTFIYNLSILVQCHRGGTYCCTDLRGHWSPGEIFSALDHRHLTPTYIIRCLVLHYMYEIRIALDAVLRFQYLVYDHCCYFSAHLAWVLRRAAFFSFFY